MVSLSTKSSRTIAKAQQVTAKEYRTHEGSAGWVEANFSALGLKVMLSGSSTVLNSTKRGKFVPGCVGSVRFRPRRGTARWPLVGVAAENCISEYERYVSGEAETQHHLVDVRYRPRVVAVVIKHPQATAVDPYFRGVPRTVPIAYHRQVSRLSIYIGAIEAIDDPITVVIDQPDSVVKDAHLCCSGAIPIGDNRQVTRLAERKCGVALAGWHAGQVPAQIQYEGPLPE